MGYDTLSLDARFTALNNGYEQIFIMPALLQRDKEREVPEPSALILLIVGLTGLAAAGRNTRKISRPTFHSNYLKLLASGLTHLIKTVALVVFFVPSQLIS